MITLLVITLLLLAAVIALIVTGWPGRELKEIEATGRDLRRELAEHRTVTMQMLHSMRIELDESLRETLEQQFESLAASTTHTTSRRRKSAPQKPVPQVIAEEMAWYAEEDSDLPSGSNGREAFAAVSDDRQLGLFSAAPQEQEPRKEPEIKQEIRIIEPISSEAPTERVESLSIGYDDIPDIEDLHHFDNL